MQTTGTEKMHIKNVDCTSTEKPKISIEFCVYSIATGHVPSLPDHRLQNSKQLPKRSTSINIRSQVKWLDVLRLSLRGRGKDFQIVSELTEQNLQEAYSNMGKTPH